MGCATDQLGILYEQNQTTIVSPTNAVAGSAFTISIDTWGNSCMSADSTVTALTRWNHHAYDKRLIPTQMGAYVAHHAAIRGFARRLVGTSEQLAIPHTASITLTTSGTEILHVIGLDAQHYMADVPLQIEVD